MSAPLLSLALPMALAAAAGIAIALTAQRRVAFVMLALSIAAMIAGFALLALAPAAPWAATIGFVGLGAACGLAGPLGFGRTPVGVAASLAATLFAYWCGLWVLLASVCAMGGGAECA